MYLMQATLKDTNPKDAIAQGKVPLYLLSPIAKAYWALAQFAGMCKYGGWNWRISGVLSSVYLSAMARHMDAYLSGEELDPVDQTHHLGNIMACAAILLDAREAGKLTDDRPPVVGLRSCYAKAETLTVALAETHKDKKPRHCTILDVVIPSNGRPPADLAKLAETLNNAQGTAVIHTENPDPVATSSTLPSAPQVPAQEKHMTSIPITMTNPDKDPPPSYAAEPDPFPSEGPATLRSSQGEKQYVRPEHVVLPKAYHVLHTRYGVLVEDSRADDAAEAWSDKTAFEGFAQDGDHVSVIKNGKVVYSRVVCL